MENINIKYKILLILTRCPYPANDGTKERILNEIKMLSTDFEISLLIISNEKITNKSKEHLQNIITGEIFIFKLSKIVCYINSFLSLFTKLPIQSLYFYRKNISTWLVNNANKFNVIHFHTIRLGEYIIDLKKEKTNNQLLLCFNDAISLNYKEASKKATGFWKLIYKIEVNRVKNYELKMLKKADGFSIVSEMDRKYIEDNWYKKYKNIKIPKIKVIRHGIDDDLFKYSYKPETNNLIFIGNLLYPPNKQGLFFFIKKIWPNIIKENPTIKLLIIGRGGEFFKKYSNVEIFGFLENPYELMIKQDLFINPVDFGAGVSTKCLLAMSLGIPVISTKVNVQSIDGIINNKNIYLIDLKNVDETTKKILKIIEEKDDRIKVGNAGKNLTSKKYKNLITYQELKFFIKNFL